MYNELCGRQLHIPGETSGFNQNHNATVSARTRAYLISSAHGHQPFRGSRSFSPTTNGVLNRVTTQTPLVGTKGLSNPRGLAPSASKRGTIPSSLEADYSSTVDTPGWSISRRSTQPSKLARQPTTLWRAFQTFCHEGAAAICGGGYQSRGSIY